MIDSGFDTVPDLTEEEAAVHHLQRQGFHVVGRNIYPPRVSTLSDETLDHLHLLLYDAMYTLKQNKL